MLTVINLQKLFWVTFSLLTKTNTKKLTCLYCNREQLISPILHNSSSLAQIDLFLPKLPNLSRPTNLQLWKLSVVITWWNLGCHTTLASGDNVGSNCFEHFPHIFMKTPKVQFVVFSFIPASSCKHHSFKDILMFICFMSQLLSDCSHHCMMYSIKAAW